MSNDSDLTAAELADWCNRLGEVLTPLDWAETALDYAQVKHSRRPHLRPHLARAISEAQEAAVNRYKRNAGLLHIQKITAN